MLTEVERGEIEVILERDGEPVAALVSPQMWVFWRQSRQAAVAHMRSVAEHTRARWEAEGLTEDDVLRMVTATQSRSPSPHNVNHATIEWHPDHYSHALT